MVFSNGTSSIKESLSQRGSLWERAEGNFGFPCNFFSGDAKGKQQGDKGGAVRVHIKTFNFLSYKCTVGHNFYFSRRNVRGLGYQGRPQ